MNYLIATHAIIEFTVEGEMARCPDVSRDHNYTNTFVYLQYEII